MSRSTSRTIAWIAVTAMAWGAGCSTTSGTTDVKGGTIKDDVSPADLVADQDADAGQPPTDTEGQDAILVDTQGLDGTDTPDTADVATTDLGGQDIAIDIPKTGDTSTGPGDQKELLIKILGPSGREWAQSEGANIQLSGVAFGGPESIAWSSSNGKSGTINNDAYWLSGIIELAQGDNTLTVTATKGAKTVTDTIHVTYNPFFSFDAVPDIAPYVVFVNESANLIAQMAVPAAAPGADGTSVVDPASLKLIEVDQDGKYVKDVGTLTDPGNGSNCDTAQKDGVYSTCVSLTATEAKPICYRVKATVTLSGKSYDALSQVVCVDAVQRFSKAECNQIVTLQAKVKADYATALAAGTPATAQAAAIAELKADASVAEAGPASAGGYGVWVRYKSGRVGALGLAPAGNRSGGGAPVEAGAALPTYSVGTRRALALAPFASQFKVAGAGDEAQQAGLALQDKQCPPFAVDAASDGEARLNWYRDMSSYGLIAITGHGDVLFEDMDTDAKKALHWEHLGAQEVVWSGEAVDCSALSSQTASCAKAGTGCPAGQACVLTSANGGV